jgi:hypothetical protein
MDVENLDHVQELGLPSSNFHLKIRDRRELKNANCMPAEPIYFIGKKGHLPLDEKGEARSSDRTRD